MNSKRVASLLLLGAMLLTLPACGEDKPVTQEIFAMDTVMELTDYGKNAEAGLESSASVINALSAMLDPELETSRVYAANHARGEGVVVNGQIAQMVKTAQAVSEKTGGALDFTVYPLLKAWGFIDSAFRLPDDAVIDELLRHVDMDALQIAPLGDEGSYLLTVPSGMEVGFGAAAKGCASNHAIQAMRAAGVTSGVISLGGNVQTLGVKPDGSDWNIAVQDPSDTGDYVGYLTVGETAVITSGSYQRNFTYGGEIYHHILDPETGYPADSHLRSVTIVCGDGILADCLSTAMFVLGEDAALRYWRENGGFDMVLITDDDRVIVTNGLYGRFTQNGDRYEFSFAS